MAEDNKNMEAALKKEISVVYQSDTYLFKNPTVKDRISIMGYALKLRSEAAPDANLAAGYDPALVMSTETIATFVMLLKSTTAKWVYSIGADSQPYIDINNWPDNVPVSEVVDQFNKELADFRASGN